MSMRMATFWLATVALTVAGCRHQAQPRATQGWGSSPYAHPSADWVRDDRPPPRYSLAHSPQYEDLLRAEVRQHGKKLQRCYLAELKTDPHQYGEMQVMFTIAHSGQVLDASIDFTTLSSPAIEPCILKLFKSLQLPPPPKPDFKVRYPLVFTSQQTPVEVVDALSERYHLDREMDAEQKAARNKPNDFKVPW